ncbi:MAG: hypothetical protein SH868_11340 [Bythopirellula sp.]|nr:hypothetical protein [Bythopirellula sp.]
MKQPLKSRVLNHRALRFERMEDRLALSATMGGDYTLNIDYLNAEQGGFIVFDGPILASGSATFSDANVDVIFSSSPRAQEYFLNLLNGHGQADLSAADTDQIAPIPQPNNQGKLGGTIELTNIFLPRTLQNSTRAERQVVQSQNTTEASQLSVLDSQAKEPSFSRGRDMYFEVASLSAKPQPRGHGAAQVSQGELVPLNREVSAGVAKSILPAAEIRDGEVKHDSAPAVPPTAPLPKADAVPTSPPVKDDSLRAAEKAANDPATKSAQQEKPTATADELSAANARDAAFAEFWTDEFMAEEVAITLRSNEGGQHYAAWPTLAVLVGGGIIARQRRSSRIHASQLQPPRRTVA